MTVYVDNMRRPAVVAGVAGAWSHLLADSPEELREFASKLRLKPEWIQHEGTYREHFDVVEGRRRRAIDLGAKPIGWKDVGPILTARRDTYGAQS